MESKEVVIQLVDDDRLIEVPAGISIIEAALLAGVKLIHSCLMRFVSGVRGRRTGRYEE